MDLSLEADFYEKYKSLKDTKTFYLIKSNDDFFAGMNSFMKELEKKFSWVDLRIKEGTFSRIECNDLSFYGVPRGHLLKFFIEIAALPEKKILSEEFEQRLFVSSNCPNCPKALDSILRFLEKKKIRSHFYFCDDNFFHAEKFNVMSVPCLVIEKKSNEIQRFVGDINLDDLEVVFEEKNKEEFSSDYFKNIIEQGKAAEIADLIVSENSVFSGFVSLFSSRAIGLRVGAAVTAEYLSEKSPYLFEDLVDRLYEVYLESSIEIKGDILYLISLSENKLKWIKELEKIEKNETNDLLKEIISDSVETLNR